MKSVSVYDRTMREGTQGLGLQLSVPEKTAFIQLLDDLGVDYLEVGEPGVNTRDARFLEEAATLQLGTSKLAAFGRIEQHPLDSVALSRLLDSGVPVLSLSASCWRSELQELEETSPEEQADVVRRVVAQACEVADEVFFDADHFFDGYLEDSSFALSIVRAAVEGGASCIVLCDSNGGTLPYHLSEIVARVIEQVDVIVGISAHNDADMAVANSLAAIKSGARIFKGTINGYGERAGSANIVSIVPALELKMGLRTLPDGSLRLLTQVARNVDQLVNHVPQPNQPYVGRSAFARKDHLAQRAGRRSRTTDEHVPPEAIGNQSRLLMSTSASQADVLAMLAEHGVFLSPGEPKAVQVVEHISTLESQGYQFEGAEASLRLLVNEALGCRKVYFTLEDLSVTVRIDGTSTRAPIAAGGALSQIRMRVGGKTDTATAKGNGPINAMDGALRAVVQSHYPTLRSVRLVDYKVRILSSGVGTESMCRVLVQSGDGDEIWGTVGVSTSIIQASWLALVDAFEYKLLKDGVEPVHAPSEHRNM